MATPSSVAVTAGSGTSVDTVTVNSKRRQVASIGDATTETNYASVTTGGELITANIDLATTGSITAADVGSSTAVGEDSQGIVTGTPTAASTVSAVCSGDSSFAVQLSGTWVGTVQFERSLDGGTTYGAVAAFSAGTQFNQATATANGSFHGNSSSATNVRVRCTAYTSGTVTVRILTGAGTGTITVGNAIRIIDSTFTNQMGISTRNGVLVEGPTASGASVAANPLTTGSRAATALPTAVADAQVVNTTSDKFGRQVILNNGLREQIASQATTITASTAETTVITAAASIFNDLSSIMVSNTSATAARLDFRDTTAGSVLFSFYVPAGDTRGISLTSPWPQTTVNTNWTVQSSVSVTDLRIAVQYIKNK